MEKMRIVNAQFNTSKKRKSTKSKSSKRSMKLVTMRKETKKTTSSSKNNKKKKNSTRKFDVVSFFRFFASPKMIQIYGIVLIIFSIIWFISIFSSYFHFASDSTHITSDAGEETKNLIGNFGTYLAYYTVSYSFGFFSIGLPFLFFLYGARICFKRNLLPLGSTTLKVVCSMAWLSVAFGCFLAGKEHEFVSGTFGNHISQLLINSVHIWGTTLILLGLFLIILILCFNFSIVATIEKISEMRAENSEKEEKKSSVKSKENFWKRLFKKEQKREYKKSTAAEKQTEVFTPAAPEDTQMGELYIQNLNGLSKEYDSNIPNLDEIPDIDDQNVSFTILNPEPEQKSEEVNDDSDWSVPLEELPEEQPSDIALPLEDYDPHLDLSMYQFPPVELLTLYESKDVDNQLIKKELNENAYKIQTTLKNFGIPIKDIYVTMGPTVTLYEIIPEDGIRISKIKNLEDDIALQLAALGIRIIAPIPGKGTVGIEVPNKNAKIVSMREIITSDKFQNNKFDLPIGLGKTISNEPLVVDLAKMPHLLMAGATGQGKSVGLNAIITSLLYKKHPSELKFVLVDPKKVEFTLYSIIEKHYLAKIPNAEKPIITDVKKVVETLNSLCVEMDARYDLLETAKVRNIKEYNAKFCTRKLSPALGHRYLPYIVLVIDEFGDLIMTAGREVETPIARLAQLARAVGIHLIIATQRPSVNIITGTIKANFPARIAFRVTSIVDSRTILDSKGAHQLVGKGDMLLSTGSDMIRLQCAFVDTPEVEKITQHIEEQQSYPEAFELPEYILDDKGGGSVDEDFANTDEIDTMFMDAARLIVETQSGSTSLIQRKLKLGYARSGRIMDQLEEFGIVGPSVGSKVREVKVKTMEELNNIFVRMGLFNN